MNDDPEEDLLVVALIVVAFLAGVIVGAMLRWLL